MKTQRLISVLAAVAITCLSAAARGQDASPKAVEHLQKEVRHELLMLPDVDVFDNLAYKVDGYNVTLYGQVTRDIVKSDAEKVVRGIEAVEKVDSQIEVLPTS